MKMNKQINILNSIFHTPFMAVSGALPFCQHRKKKKKKITMAIILW